MKPLIVILALLAAGGAQGATTCEPGMPRYRATAVTPPVGKPYLTPGGAIRMVGYNDMRGMIGAWNAAYSALHPGFRFEADLPSTRSAPPALTSGTSALGPMGAPFTREDLAAYRTATGGAPVVVSVAHDSLNPAALSGPLAILVARTNPLRSISLAQIQRVFASARPPRWRALGVRGALADRPIQIEGLKPGTALALFFEARALSGQPLSPALEGYGHSTDVVARLKDDPEAIGFAAANAADAGVRLLPIRESKRAPAVAPTRKSLRAGRYPLDRRLLIYASSPVEPWAADYLSFVLSCEGQRIVAQDPLGYIPLSAAEVRAQRRNLP